MKREIYDSDHELFRDSVRQFLERQILPRSDEFLEARAVPRDVWLEAGKQGFLGLQVPEEFGGSDAGDYRYTAVITEEFAKVSASLSSCLSIHIDVVAPYLTELTTAEQRARWLPGFCTGETWTAIAMTEPSGGSDLAALRTTAVRDGSQWVLSGSKTFITNGYSADLVVVAARTTPSAGARGITLFGVETGTPGFSRGRKLDKVGQAESDTSELFFQEVRLDGEAILGGVDRGFVHMMERLPQERLACAVSNVAHAAQILDETIEYVKERHAFSRPIGSFQHNKFLVAAMVTKLEATQAFVDRAIMAHVNSQFSAVDAAKVKMWTADIQNEVLDNCVQLYGGYGYMNEYRVARAWRDARVTRIWGGSNEIMKELIGRDLGL